MRTRKQKLFELVGYAPHPGQVLVHRSTALRRVLACGTRWGKTTGASMECVATLLEPRDSALGWIVAPTFELTQRIFLRVAHTFQEKLPHRVKAILPREQRILVTNLAGGISELRAKSADQPAGLLGEALDFVVIDEAGSIRDDVWPSYVMPRLIDKRGWSLVVGTPKGPGWFHEQYRRGQRNRDPNYESWSMPSWTNPHVSAETIEEERSMLTGEAFNEQFGAEFIGVPAEPCFTCGGPRRDNPESIILAVGTEPPKCSECGMPVRADGQCAVKDYGFGYWSLDLRYMEPSGEEDDREVGLTWYRPMHPLRRSLRWDPKA